MLSGSTGLVFGQGDVALFFAEGGDGFEASRGSCCPRWPWRRRRSSRTRAGRGGCTRSAVGGAVGGCWPVMARQTMELAMWTKQRLVLVGVPVGEVVGVVVDLLAHAAAGGEAHVESDIGAGRHRHVADALHKRLDRVSGSRLGNRFSKTSRFMGYTMICRPPCSASPVICSSAV